MIIGRPGSGKSTLAYELSKRLDLPLYHLDKIFFSDHWKPREYEEFLTDQRKIINQNRWIIDGCNSRSYEMRYEKSDVCIFLVTAKWLCYWRALKRVFKKNKNVDDRAENCKEQFSWELMKYMWGFDKRVEKLIPALKSKYPNVKFISMKY